MNAEQATELLNNLVVSKKGEHLDRLQQAIIQGVLEGLIYQEIQENYSIARHYSIGFLAQCKAYHLWKLLTEVLQDAGIIGSDERVRNKNLLECAMRAAQQSVQSPPAQKSQPPILPVDSMLDRILQMRYRITEHLAKTEFSDAYMAEDEGVSDRPLCTVKRWKMLSNSRVYRSIEFKLWQLPKHDRLPELLAIFLENGYLYIIHKFIEGQPLSQELIYNIPWKEEQVIALIQEILEILIFLHQHQVAHGNIHPGNLIRRAADSKIMLVDFAADKAISTYKGYILPEPATRFPKLCNDLYAVGLLGIRAITGLPPRMLRVNPENGEVIWRDRAQVSAPFADFLDKMVGGHYKSASEALQALKNLA